MNLWNTIGRWYGVIVIIATIVFAGWLGFLLPTKSVPFFGVGLGVIGAIIALIIGERYDD